MGTKYTSPSTVCTLTDTTRRKGLCQADRVRSGCFSKLDHSHSYVPLTQDAEIERETKLRKTAERPRSRLADLRGISLGSLGMIVPNFFLVAFDTVDFEEGYLTV